MPASQVGTYSQLRLEAQVYPSPAGNYWQINWQLYFEETGGNNLAWKGSPGVSASVAIDVLGTVWSGSFTFDWRPGGNQGVTVATGTNYIYADAAGNPPGGYISASNGATGSSGGGSGGSVGFGLGLSKLWQAPGAPTSVVATRVSDTQVSLAWNQANPGNGQPTATHIDVSHDGGATWVSLLDLGGASSATVTTVANQKSRYRVYTGNPAASMVGPGISNDVFTTPAAPTNVVSTKDASLNITTTFTDNVGYPDHTHEVWHGTVLGGVTTWDGAALATLPSGTVSYTHNAPDPSKVHIYEMRAVGGGLNSAYAVGNSVQLLAAPNKPTTPAMNPFADKAAALDFAWVHNPVDTTPQTAYEFQVSTNGGTTWSNPGKTVSAVQKVTIAANAYASGVALTTRVRTWGSATTGGSDGTGASPWSDLRTVTYKTAPTTSITSPANGSNYADATLRSTVTFAQAEGATFVKSQFQLLEGVTVLENLDSTIQVGVTFATQLQNGHSYTLKARVQDSNGVWSAWASNNFNEVYLAPVPAQVTAQFIKENGFGQLDLVIPAPGAGQSAATKLTITRTIDNVTETIVKDYPVSAALTFLDTTPVVNGHNVYTITTTSALGAVSTVTSDLLTTELRRAYLSKGTSFQTVVVFGGNLKVDEDLSVANDTMQAAGRVKPIGLYGVETSVGIKVTSRIIETMGSSMSDIRKLVLMTGKACYRDPSGRRVFGTTKGGLSYDKGNRGDFSFSMTETS